MAADVINGFGEIACAVDLGDGLSTCVVIGEGVDVGGARRRQETGQRIAVARGGNPGGNAGGIDETRDLVGIGDALDLLAGRVVLVLGEIAFAVDHGAQPAVAVIELRTDTVTGRYPDQDEFAADSDAVPGVEGGGGRAGGVAGVYGAQCAGATGCRGVGETRLSTDQFGHADQGVAVEKGDAAGGPVDVVEVGRQLMLDARIASGDAVRQL